ncbi:MAG: DUF3999 family protein [Nitrospirae bacterium]|nr:DUF3999 family protein [Nitrospirota bacterium]
MRRTFFLISMLCFAAIMAVTQDASAASERDFRYIAPIAGAVKKGMLYRVHLTPDILQKCAANCTDLRLFDSKNGEVPYIILNDTSPGQPVESYTLKIIDYTAAKNGSTAEITMQMPDTFKPITVISIGIEARDFQKGAVLYGSSDLKQWQVLAEDTLYDFTSQVDLRKASIHFNSSSYQYYRLKLSEPDEQQKKINLTYEGLKLTVNDEAAKKLKISSVTGLTTASPDIISVYDNMAFSGFKTQTTANKGTAITLEAALPFNRIYFNITNPYYNRRVRVSYSDKGTEGPFTALAGTMGIYAFPAYQTRNFIEFTSEKHQYYRIEIENRSSPPLDIKEIKFEWIRKHIFFVALRDDDSVALHFGYLPIERPDYDLSSFINQDNWFKRQYETLKAGSASPNPAYKPTIGKSGVEKTILRVIVIALVLLIGYWIYRLALAAKSR